MATRDYESAPETERLGLDSIIRGLASDLDALRAGTISVPDAIARAMLGKQIFNGVRLHLSHQKIVLDSAKDVTPPANQIEGDKP